MSLFPLLRNSAMRWKSTGEILSHGVREKLLLSFAPVECRKCSSNCFLVENAEDKRGQREKGRKTFLVLGFIIAGSYFLARKKTAFAEKAEPLEPGKFIKNLPVYTESDVAKHKTKESRIWVTYKNGVYDVTDFVDVHPGGSKILLAAGSSIEPYWALYGVHHSQSVYELLEQHRIGNIEGVASEDTKSEYFANEPERSPVLRRLSATPCNAEPPASLLVDNFYTPNSIFYVRNHLAVPAVDVEQYRLQICGMGVKKTLLTLDDIKKFPKCTVSATIQCAGNRRSEMSEVKAVQGLSWGLAALGNATWAGARLTDVLKSCGLDLERTDVQHVQFQGLDKGPDEVHYGASIPAEKALDPRGDVILAYEMNGEPIPRDHGFPLRVVVPGVVGARNVKWVHRITLSDKESNSHWQQKDYKGFSPSTDWNNIDYSVSPAIQELPVTSAICVPANGEAVDVVDGGIICKGYAWSGGGRRIVRVDVSSDKGKTWHVADLEQLEDKASRHWAWTLWSIYLPVPEDKTVEIWAKAVDSSYNSQPENFDYIWNLRGVLSHAYHRIKVELKKPGAAAKS